ncbi:uncharacterized protein LOC121371257 [Gigantopelta aegis]|uniref:uncharacterized protein LOC121371257 n=1 Tax=Gigantopelta aegis TaxID=1735272 RepID=UPI001B88A57D|nr:uncharacterized protein LOC121371257 [Gigantopelta aegis]
MAHLSMGAFGAYQHSYSEYLKERKERENRLNPPEPEVVWVTKRYDPTDLRFTAPTPRHKLVVPRDLPPVQKQFVPVGLDPPLRYFDRDLQRDGIYIYASSPCTRSEEWSTLRQILPSKGPHFKVGPPKWGTGLGYPPFYSARPKRRNPTVNSPMTKYVDDMHIADKLFRLY